jgi:RNA polymerase subunit RPABC4/transcription elongation factor Spt4
MGIACAVAIVAISFLALDAIVDVNSSAIAKRIEMAQASIADAAMSQHQLAFAVQAWARRNHQKQPSAIE